MNFRRSKLSLLMWSIMALVVISEGTIQIAYSIINENIRVDLNLTLTQIALAASIHMWSFAIFQLFTGSILDNWGGEVMIPFSMAVTVIGTFILKYANTFFELASAQVILAFGSSFGFAGAAYIIRQWFPEKKFGIMFGFVQTCYGISSLILQSLCTIWNEHDIIWQEIINYINYFNILIFFLSLFIKDKNICKQKTNNFASFRLPFKEVLTIKTIYFTLFSGSIIFGVFLSIAVLWGPKLLLETGFNTMESGIATSMIWLGLVIGAPIVNYFSNLFKNRRCILLVFSMLQCMSFILLNFCSNVLSAGILMFLFGFASSGHMLNFVVASDIVKPQFIATAIALINGFMTITSGLIMLVMSGDVYIYKLSFQIVCLLQFINIIILMYMSETYRK